MIGIGWLEMLVIGVVALIVIGPKELPALMQKMGRAIGTIRRMGQEFQREINRSTGLDTITDIRKSITEPLKKTSAEIAREFNATTASGTTRPSGVIKPADPKAGTVVKEIQAAAGMPPAPVVESPAPVPAAPPQPEPVAKTPAKRVRAAKRVESPGPVEALAPATAMPPKAPRKRAAPRVKTAQATAPADDAEAGPKPNG
jgi:sec-independent protein translocase protein TatB